MSFEDKEKASNATDFSKYSYNPNKGLTFLLELTNIVLAIAAVAVGFSLFYQFLHSDSSYKVVGRGGGLEKVFYALYLAIYGFGGLFYQTKFWLFDRQYSLKHKQVVIYLFCCHLIWICILFPMLFAFFFLSKN